MQSNLKMSNIQFELLKLYSNNVPDSDLLEIKEILAKYFQSKLDNAMNTFIENNNLKSEDLDKWAFEHNRISC